MHHALVIGKFSGDLSAHLSRRVGAAATIRRSQGGGVRITRVQAFHCDAGWRPWTFVKVDTDAGVVGWGECSDSRNPYGVAGSVRDLEELRVGEDPRATEPRYWDMLRVFRQNLGCTSAKARAGIPA